MHPDNEKHTRFQINLAYFAGVFGLSQIAEYVGDQIHNSDITDIPRGTVVLLGIGSAAIGTLIRDTVSKDW